MLRRVTDFLNEYLRINAIRRMLAVVEVHTSEVVGLVAFAVAFALFEGIGLTLLLPILQYAEGGEAAVLENSGPIWAALLAFMESAGLPLTLPVLLVLAFIPILLRQVVFYFNAWYSAVVAGRIGIRMRMKTLRTVLDADPDYFSWHPVGHLVGVILNQTAQAGAAVLAVIKQLSTVLLMALYTTILLAISVPLTLSALFFAVLVSLVVRANVRKTREFGVDTTRISQRVMAQIVERFGLMRFIKMRDQKELEAKRIEEYSDEMRVIGVKQARLAANTEVTADPLLMLSVFITLFIGISVLGMSLAELGLLLFVLNRLNAKVKEFNAGRQLISANVAGILMVKYTLETANKANTIHRGTIHFEGLKDAIVVQDVRYEYPDVYASDGVFVKIKGGEVLRDVDVTIPAGSFTAIVGRSGSGKSTLVELLPRLRDVSGGSITYDGVSIRDFELGSLRKGVGYLTQSAMLFDESVRDNLTYGLEYEPTDQQIREALSQAYAQFVYDLPDGLDTILGGLGVRFSGGERQRLALARVLLEDTSLLILDEPTSALDSESETYIQKALAELHGKKTIIVIAHRLATVIQADQLLVMEDGRIVERGTHTELLEAGPKYQRLFESQLL